MLSGSNANCLPNIGRTPLHPLSSYRKGGEIQNTLVIRLRSLAMSFLRIMIDNNF